ncbi:RhoGAP-domain-containing protein [Laetiporus sulphureus 93-53]|uniref:RhoGAP-domain-containing protein n=1 Tax=Laetiporus sulphureus 93-53 TaxID=1314785 RepID=A0A165ENA5_9APHY|nr:RhoGAP-domain-containing protein [Laetiporus sulphureus 93-53]KZT07421.1 RhoGAP-domain-containing protein [Laetiporus sulphureus 93-53]
MSEERHSTSSWDNADSDTHHSSHHHSSSYGRTPHGHAVGSLESLDVNGAAPPTPTKSSPPRSSGESHARPSTSKWRDSTLHATTEVADTSTLASALLEPSFDESILRALCDMDCGIQLLLDRIKQSMVSCREAAAFFKKRALLEEEYGRNMLKLAKTTSDAYSMNEGKAGTYVAAWQSAMKTHEHIADNRIRFAQRLHEMSQELTTLAKEVDSNRKNVKELSNKYEKVLQEHETAVEKYKSRVDTTAEELERLLLQKEGEPYRDTPVQGRTPVGVSGGGKRAIGKAVAKGGLLLKGRNPGNLQRQEDDIRARMSKESDTYRKSVMDAQVIRQEYFNFQYPRLLRSLKEYVDELDLGTQYHLSRYAFLCESIVMSDGTTLTAVDDNGAPGLKGALDSIDNRTDFKTYMQNYAFAHGGSNAKGPRRDGPRDEGFLPPIAAVGPHATSSPSMAHPQITDKGRPTFGVDLAEQMARDDVEVPPIMTKCCEAIEKYGLETTGVYRIGGTMSRVAKLKERLDRADLDSVNLDAEEWSSDISNVTSVLKLWLRELPDPLLTSSLHHAFLEAARNENERLRQIRLHERVNDLPDPNYSTLKYLMGHLHKVVQHEDENAMSIQNLAIVFGPTLFGQRAPDLNGQINGMADASLQNKAIESILEHYTDIFVDENENEAKVI